jgi:hypothetical protein
MLPGIDGLFLGLAQLLVRHHDGAADPQQGVAQVLLLLLQPGQQLLADLYSALS